tara:strand:- start:15719 stop:16465 length:747 start_codon:yes stop_codon:yes gene_type:complete
MIADNLCTPALLYIGFTILHIVIDLFNKLYNSALIKFTLMIVFSVILNLLCKSGLGILSWIIVFIPFILLSTITLWLLVSLGWSIDSGYLYYKIKDETEVSNQENGVEIVGQTIDTSKINTLAPESIDTQTTTDDVNIQDTDNDGSASTSGGSGSASTSDVTATGYSGCPGNTVWCPTEYKCVALVGAGAGCLTNPQQPSTIDTQNNEASAAGLINGVNQGVNNTPSTTNSNQSVNNANTHIQQYHYQ